MTSINHKNISDPGKENGNTIEPKGKGIKFSDENDTSYPEFDDDFDDMHDDDSDTGCWSCFNISSKSKSKNTFYASDAIQESFIKIMETGRSFRKNKQREDMINFHSAFRAQRANIYTAPVDLSEDFVAPSFPKSEDETIFIRKALMDNFLFSSLSQNNIKTLIGAMESVNVDSDTTIIEQGDVISDYFYIVKDGVVDFIVDGNNVGKCCSGGSFGELALLYNSPRAATCMSEMDCALFKLDQNTFRYIVAAATTRENKELYDTLKLIPFFSELDEQTLSRLTDLFTTVTFAEDEVLYRRGDRGDVLYIVKTGSVLLSDLGSGESKYVDVVSNPGACFGEMAILTKGGIRQGAATAISPNTETFCLSRFDFEEVFGDQQEMLILCEKRNLLNSVPIFASSGLQPHEHRQLMDLFKRESFPKGHVLVASGQPCLQTVYFIHSGIAMINKDSGVINNLTKGDYFGDTFIQEPFSTPSNEAIVIEEDTICFGLSKSDIISIVGSDRLGKGSLPEQTRRSTSRTIELSHLNKIKILGAGTFGIVWLVTHKKTRNTYALKLCEKKQIMEYGQVKGIIREKHVLTSLEHPFILNLVSTYQDRFNLLFLFDLVQGGELYKLICASGHGLPNSDAVFYAACLLEAFSYLHDRRICYRDLKPENVLIDTTGYCRLVDMGFAKVVLDKTFTFCGTPEYLAPEIILSKGHNQGVDCWAFGVIIYEMLVGKSPFFNEHGMDQTSLFKRIVRLKYKFPQGNVVNDSAKDLIKRLLLSKAHDRCSFTLNNRNCVRSHDWFVADNNPDYFDDLMKKKIVAPWTPTIKSSTDSSNFDDFSSLENVPQNKTILTSKEQKLFTDF